MAVEISLKGKVVLVTGGTRGIGKSIVEKFLEAGANVLATGTNLEKIDNLNKNNKNSFLRYLQLDLNDLGSVKDFIESMLKSENIHILVNNAGINIVADAIDINNDEFEKIQRINTYGPYMLAQALGKKMILNKWGRIINIASIWSIVSKSGRLSYSTSKMALLGITKTLSIEWAKYNVLVNSVSPGFTLTELTESTNSKHELKIIKKKIPQNRMARPDEIANTVLFLASELNSYTVGQNITIDGGYTSI